MQRLSLTDYNIYIGQNNWATLAKYLSDYTQIVLLIDENTQKYCLPIFKENIKLEFDTILIPSGEIHKNINTIQHIWTKLQALNISRKALLINLGGGVIGDMGGFAARTYKRGIDFIQIPTTLLAQVDASIGGKLGFDFNNIKNGIGLFSNPKAVFINPLFLKTLPTREIRSGLAEVIKHSLIKDTEQWEALTKIEILKNIDWATYLLPSLRIKQQIVQEDPFEQGIRKSLNFGHTIGHAIESFYLNTKEPLLHGEAIAIGMICEAYISNSVNDFRFSEVKKIANFIIRLYGKRLLETQSFENLLSLMKQDKKNEDSRINFTLLEKIGKATVNQYATTSIIKESLYFYNKELV